MLKDHLRRSWVNSLRGRQSGWEKALDDFKAVGFYAECNWKPLKGFRQENNINFMIQRDHSASVHRKTGRGMEAGEAGEQESHSEQS